MRCGASFMQRQAHKRRGHSLISVAACEAKRHVATRHMRAAQLRASAPCWDWGPSRHAWHSLHAHTSANGVM